jgi:CRP-like cAMP-binding protein
MEKSFEKFKLYLAPFGLNDNDFDVLVSYCEALQFKKGDVVMKAGEKQSFIYFIVKGIIRNYVLSQEGEIKTYGFRVENMLITGYGLHNYKNDYRAKVNIECLEECTLIKIPLQALKFMEEHSKEAHKVGRYLAETHIIELVEFIIDIDTLPVLERYNNLEKIFPNIHQRVPQHIIASYLRVTPVHLSNVKKRNFLLSKTTASS